MTDEIEIILELEDEDTLDLEIIEEDTIDVDMETDTIEIVTSNYEQLNNLPKINDVQLKGNKTSKELKLQDEMDSISNLDIDKIFNL